jgi:hypothetical protein
MSDEESNLPVPYDLEPRQVYQLKMQGLLVSDIAELYRTDKQQVVGALRLELKHDAEMLTDEDRNTTLKLENDRLDYYLTKLWPSIDFGDTKAIALALKITELRLKANQIDKPSSGGQTNQVLVIGGMQADYVERLKQIVDKPDGD